jgi:hypothetical protein
MIEILAKGNEYVNSQHTSTKISMIQITYEYKLNITKKRKRNPPLIQISGTHIDFGAIRDGTPTIPTTSTHISVIDTPMSVVSLSTLLTLTELNIYTQNMNDIIITSDVTNDYTYIFKVCRVSNDLFITLPVNNFTNTPCPLNVLTSYFYSVLSNGLSYGIRVSSSYQYYANIFNLFTQILDRLSL